MQKSNFFIHAPVQPDPAPAVILEAIESKIPVIYSNKGGAKEILDNGKNGLEIDLDSIKNSSEIILNYINQDDLHQRRVKDAVTYVSKNFNLELYKIKLLTLLKKY